MVVIDTEVYRDYFLLAARDIATGKTAMMEMFPGSPSPARRIMSLMSSCVTVSFNGNGYDLLIIAALLRGDNNAQLKKLSDLIITGERPSWAVARDADLNTAQWDHIDLIEVAPGQASLKVYGGRLGAPKMQDLPISPSASISPADREVLRKYCLNDLDVTVRLYKALEKQIALRVSMSEQYGLDLRSKSDAQIAEAVIKHELTAKTGKRYSAPKLNPHMSFAYRDPGIIEFRAPALKDVFQRILATDFRLSPNGSVQMPEWLKAERIEVHGRAYQMGIGGLHSCEKSQCVRRGEGEFLADFDVASYYPNIILQQGLAPQHLGADFLGLYQSLVERRIAAKHSGDMTTANTLKIVLNGSFGKFGSKYSALYSPHLLIQTTITGQLALLMLIERMGDAGISTVSANTDGVVLHGPSALDHTAEAIAWEWMLDTSYTLERTDYKLLASRDVNNYLAVKPSGDVKGKGIFASPGLSKNPDGLIVYRAVMEAVANGTPVERTITHCEELRDFVTVRRVTGGAVWDGEPLGKTVRFYRSDSVPSDVAIHYAKNGNRVPKSEGVRPVLDLPEWFPEDVNYEAYIADAHKLLGEIGYA